MGRAFRGPSAHGKVAQLISAADSVGVSISLLSETQALKYLIQTPLGRFGRKSQLPSIKYFRLGTGN